MTILVSGAAGNVGGEVVAALLERGTRVRALTRTAREWPEGVEGFVGDLGDPASVAAAADGVDGAFLLSGYPAEAALLERLGEARVALLSASSAPLGEGGNAMAAYHLESERAVEASSARWTIVRSCSLQSNLARWRDQLEAGDLVRAPFGDVPTAIVDPADIAAVCALWLTGDGDAGVTHRVSGPEPLTPAEQIAILAEALGRPLRFEGIPDEEARGELVEQMGEDYAAALFEIFRGNAEFESEVQPTVEEVLGRPPGSLRAWIERNRERFA